MWADHLMFTLISVVDDHGQDSVVLIAFTTTLKGGRRIEEGKDGEGERRIWGRRRRGRREEDMRWERESEWGREKKEGGKGKEGENWLQTVSEVTSYNWEVSFSDIAPWVTILTVFQWLLRAVASAVIKATTVEVRLRERRRNWVSISGQLEQPSGSTQTSSWTIH